MDDYINLLSKKEGGLSAKERMNQYAMQILGKVPLRDEIFIETQAFYGGFNTKGMLAVMRKLSRFAFHLQSLNLSISAPILQLIEKCMALNFTLGAVMFTITFSFFVISTIVINQMMTTDVEERTYEFAMLRTLGFSNYSFITLINIQTLIYSVPATIMGFILLFIFNSGVRLILFFVLGMSVEIHIQLYTYWLGIATGIFLPLLSNIFPIRSAMSHTLRDSLD